MAAQNTAQRSGQSGPISQRKKSRSITPGAITTLQTVAVDFALAEAKPGDVISVSFNAALTAGIICSAVACLVAGTVKIYFANITAGTLTQPAITANVSVQKGVGG